MCVGDLEVRPELVTSTAQSEVFSSLLFEMSVGSSIFDHIKPISNEFGIRGRMPRYKLGRYGPHSNDALSGLTSPSDVVANAPIKEQNTSRVHESIFDHDQAVVLVRSWLSSSNFAVKGSNRSQLQLSFRMTYCIVKRSTRLDH